jgi:putative membrane protein (TIGR04086 family)
MNKSVPHSHGIGYCALCGLIASVATALFAASLFALAALAAPDPSKYASVLAPAALFLAAFAGGFASARKRGGATILCGALAALLLLALASLLALCLSLKMNVSFFLLRALGALICAVLGANLGVGSLSCGKRKNKKRKNRT